MFRQFFIERDKGCLLYTSRAWLGHVGLETTNRYAEINLRMKQKALEACQPPVADSPATRPARSVWRDDAELLKWLKAL